MLDKRESTRRALKYRRDGEILISDQFNDQVIEINQNAVFYGMRAQLPAMAAAAGGGAIVNMASVQSFATQKSVAAYTTGKHGLIPENRRRLMCLSMFWHFLDVVWIGVFTFVYLLGMLR